MGGFTRNPGKGGEFSVYVWNIKVQVAFNFPGGYLTATTFMKSRVRDNAASRLATDDQGRDFGFHADSTFDALGHW